MVVGNFTTSFALDSTQKASNLVLNGDFESGNTSGWSTQGSTVINAVTEQAIGMYSMKVTGRSDGWNAPTYNLLGKMENGKKYSISLKVRAVANQGIDNPSVNVTIARTSDNSTKYDSIAYGQAITDGSWTEIKSDYTLSDTSPITNLFFYVESSSKTLQYYIDEVLILPPSSPAIIGNLVSNSNFETGTSDGWSTQGAKIQAVSEQAIGNYSMKVTGRTATWNAPTYNLFGKMENGKKYSVSLKVRSVAGQEVDGKTNSVNVSIKKEADGTTKYETILWNKTISETGWTELTGEYTLSYTSDLKTLIFYVESSNAKLEYYIDDVVIEIPVKTGFNSTFEDGTTQGWSNRGEEKVSISSEIKHDGNNSLKISNRTATWNGPVFNALNSFTQGKTYHISAWVMYNSGNPTQSFSFSTQKVSGGIATYGTIKSSTLIRGQWTLLEGDYTVPVDSNMSSLQIYIETAYKTTITSSDIIDFYIDDINASLVKVIPLDYQKDIPNLHDALDSYFPIGATVDPSDLDSTSIYSGVLKKHFKSLVYGNSMKPDAIQPTEGNFVWSNSDKIVNFTQANNMKLRGHTLLWHTQIKDWFFTDPSDSTKPASRELLLSRMENHIKTIVGKYKGKVHSWDVVNEVVSSNGNGLRGLDENSKWTSIVGDVDNDGYLSDYIERAFIAAHSADPDAQLVINDYGIETSGAKRDNMFKLVKRLKEKGIPIDAVGFQTHISVNYPAVDEIKKSIELFASLGVKVLITELDVSVYNSSSEAKKTVTNEILLEQAYKYKRLFDVFKEEAQKGNLDTVTLWGISDLNSWLNDFPVTGRGDAPLLFDANLQAKPSFWAITDPSKLPVKRQIANSNNGTPIIYAKKDKFWEMSSSLSVNSFVKGTEGATAKVKTLWDSNNLYIQAHVIDSTPNSNDSIEIFLDKNYGKTKIYELDDIGYTIKADNSMSQDINHLVNKTDDGYIVRAVIPISDINPIVGTQIGIDFKVNDDKGLGTIDSTSVWNDFTNCQSYDTSKFGDLKFEKESKITEVVYGTPTIDGIADSIWDKANLITADTFVSGSLGSTAQVKTMWDKDYLYVLADVTDNMLSKASTNPWEQDSVEIFIDQNNEKTSTYQSDDSQYRINFNNETSFSTNCDKSNFKSGTKITQNGYIVEAAIPLNSVKGSFGTFMGFDIQVNDDKNGNGVRDNAAIWNDSTGNSYNNTSKLGTVLLVDKEAPEISQPDKSTILQTEKSNININVNDPISGVSKVMVQLDGKDVAYPIEINPASLKVGTHTIKVTAVDFADNFVTKEFNFEVMIDIYNLDTLIKVGYEKGFINGNGIYNSLLEQAQNVEKHSVSSKKTLNALKSFKMHVEALAGNKIDKEFAGLVLDDILYLENIVNANVVNEDNETSNKNENHEKGKKDASLSDKDEIKNIKIKDKDNFNDASEEKTENKEKDRNNLYNVSEEKIENCNENKKLDEVKINDEVLIQEAEIIEPKAENPILEETKEITALNTSEIKDEVIVDNKKDFEVVEIKTISSEPAVVLEESKKGEKINNSSKSENSKSKK